MELNNLFMIFLLKNLCLYQAASYLHQEYSVQMVYVFFFLKPAINIWSWEHTVEHSIKTDTDIEIQIEGLGDYILYITFQPF